MTIRPARVGDELAIARVEVTSVQASRRGIYDDAYLACLSIEAATVEVANALREEGADSRLWVVERSGIIVAFAQTAAWSESGIDPSTAYLANLYVEPRLFRHGIGSRLLRFVEAELVATGFRRVVAWVVEEAQAAQAFYAALGWRRTARFRQILLDQSRLVRLWQKALTKQGETDA